MAKEEENKSRKKRYQKGNGGRKEVRQNKTESENTTTAKSVCALETTQSGTGSMETEISDAESKHEKFFQRQRRTKRPGK